VSILKPTPEELEIILADHAAWLADSSRGTRANLTRADLTGANLTRANLTRADLSEANLTWANLSEANLTRADLTGANLTRADLTGANLSWAYLTGAYLSWAYLSRANLTGANLSWAYLTRANLTGANLSWAYLTVADLSEANLTWANLTRAVGVVRERQVDLLMLLDQPGPIRAYKLVTAGGDSPVNGSPSLHYEIGATVEVPNANTDPNESCGVGIHVATLPWVLREWREGYRVLLVEFTAADIACIPTATDGKFRLHRCTVAAEKDVSAFVGGKS
jgi:hypothetical protein